MEKYRKVLEFAVYNTNRNIIKKDIHKTNAAALGTALGTTNQ